MEKSGYQVEWFVDIFDKLAEYICPFCLNVCRDAQQCKNGHLFCAFCVMKAHLKNVKCCPTCRTGKLTSEHIHNNLFARKEINNLPVRCVCFSSEFPECQGCGWTGPLSQRSSRLSTCFLMRVIPQHKVHDHQPGGERLSCGSSSSESSAGTERNGMDGNTSRDSDELTLGNGSDLSVAGNIIKTNSADVFGKIGKEMSTQKPRGLCLTGNSDILEGNFNMKESAELKCSESSVLNVLMPPHGEVFTSTSDDEKAHSGELNYNGVSTPSKNSSLALRSLLNVETQSHISTEVECVADHGVTGTLSTNKTAYIAASSVSQSQSDLRFDLSLANTSEQTVEQTSSRDTSHTLLTNTSEKSQFISNIQMTVSPQTVGAPLNDYLTSYQVTKSQKGTNKRQLDNFVIDLTADCDNAPIAKKSRLTTKPTSSVVHAINSALNCGIVDLSVNDDDVSFKSCFTVPPQQFALPGYSGHFNANGERHGIGIMLYTDSPDAGARYEGQWKCDMICGEGQMTWADGKDYKGQWLANQRHGRGTLSGLDGTFFSGTWHFDAFHGFGKLTLLDGSCYEGQWRDDKWHGVGSLVLPSCDIFTGCFVNGIMCSYGEMEYLNGDVYCGEWCDGVRQGRGELRVGGCRVYDGQWAGDKWNGVGRAWRADGVYSGHFVDNAMHGTGVMTYTHGPNCGGVYRGSWIDGVRCGEGEMEYANGDLYKGSWSGDKRCGRGKMLFMSGETYCGAWVGNKIHGLGVMTLINGDTLSGEWQQGNMTMGTMKYSNGDKYSGEWCGVYPHQKYHGEGSLSADDGSVTYVGNFHNGFRYGAGILRIQSVQYSYDGEWRDGQRHGRGKCVERGDVFEGDFVNDVKCGHGTLTYLDGGAYTGQFADGDPHGRGQMTLINDCKYIGNFVEGRIEGCGVMHYFGYINPGADLCVIRDEGHFLDGKLIGRNKRTYSNGVSIEGIWLQNGSVMVTLPNGDQYVGGLFLGLFSGRGTMNYHNLDTYTGEWLANKRHGQGKFSTAAGDIYVGQFENDLKHGRGTMTYVDDDSAYSGLWEYGLKKGQCTFKFGNGNVFVGEWNNGGPSGSGIMTYVNGDEYDGGWVSGKRHGFGRHTVLVPDSTDCEANVYSGDFVDDMRCGVGVETYPGGSYYTGGWLADQRHGTGELYAPASGPLGHRRLLYKGQWANGMFNGLGKQNFGGGDAYKGMHKDDQFSGHGTYFQRGNKYVAFWRNGESTCGLSAVMTYTNGDVYKGKWSPQTGKCGKGVFIKANGTVQSGKFRDDCLNGKCEIKFNDGNIFRGIASQQGTVFQGVYIYEFGGSYKGRMKPCRDGEDNLAREGLGVLTYSSGEVAHEGLWINDLEEARSLG